MKQNDNKPVSLVILSGGGFLFETQRILASIGESAEFIYLKTEFGGTPGEGGLPDGKSWLVPTFATKTKTAIYRSVYAFLRTFTTTLILVRAHRVNAIICVGCSHGVPMFLAGRLLGVTTVYVESITRVDQLSTTGKIIYYCRLASQFIVQWPNLRDYYPLSSLGSLL